MAGFKSAATRKRELAKLDKRTAKEQKRAVRKAERARADTTAPALPTIAMTPHKGAGHGVAANATATPKPLTLAEVVERWKATKVGQPTTRPRGHSPKRV